MRTPPRATSRDLRLAIDYLPRHTREAMLEGIRGHDIIVGAYATGDGICPMLAAHRHGGRTNFISFARAWDQFAFRDSRARRRGRARPATERELRVLRVHLEASLLDDGGPVAGFAAVRREHEQLRAAGARPSHRFDAAGDRDRRAGDRDGRAEDRNRRPGDRDRRHELDSRPGGSWMRVVRRYDEYERLLERLQVESERDASATAPV